MKKPVLVRTLVLVLFTGLLIHSSSIIAVHSMRANTSSEVPSFWLLAIETFAEYQVRDGQRLISTLLHYPNWNNSTGYTSHIHLLSQYPYANVSDEAKPCLVGMPYRINVQAEVTGFLAQAKAGDIVMVYVGCHGNSVDFMGIGVSHAELSSWLSSGNLTLCYVTVIVESCQSGGSIGDGKGGVLGPNHNVLCACMGNESCFGWGDEEGSCFLFSHLVTEGFSLATDSDGDGWISVRETFDYAKPMTEQLMWVYPQHPVSYYGQANGDVPLVQRDSEKNVPDLPPLIEVLSPQNVTYTKFFIPAAIASSEPLSWLVYSLDGASNITVNDNVLLSGLPDGSHSIVFYGCDFSGNVGSSLRIFFSVDATVVDLVLNLSPGLMKLCTVGKLLSASFEPSAGLNLSEVEVSTILLNGTLQPEYGSVRLEDNDGDSVQELVMSFDFANVSELALEYHVTYGNLVLNVSGRLFDGTLFSGTGIIVVRMPGDACIDGKVDMRDVSAATIAFGSSPGQPRWNALVDENEDGLVDWTDINLIAGQFGANYT